MKKLHRFLVLLSILILCFPLTLTVSAHRGKTDSNGGHTDHSTGEYHYHHGYSAHNHYDIDGDGDIDCPYDFKDTASHSSGYSNGITSNIGNNDKPEIEPSSSQTVPSTNTSSSLKENPEMWMIWIIAGLLLVVFGQHIKISHKDDELCNVKTRHRIDLEKQKKHYETIISTSQELDKLQKQVDTSKKEQSKIAVLIAKERVELRKVELDRIRVRNAPLDVTFADDGMPIYWKPNSEKPYGDYTVYINMRSHVYHVNRFCSTYGSRADHIFNVIDHARPCRKCAEGFYNFTTVPDWYVPK